MKNNHRQLVVVLILALSSPAHARCRRVYRILGLTAAAVAGLGTYLLWPDDPDKRWRKQVARDAEREKRRADDRNSLVRLAARFGARTPLGSIFKTSGWPIDLDHVERVARGGATDDLLQFTQPMRINGRDTDSYILSVSDLHPIVNPLHTLAVLNDRDRALRENIRQVVQGASESDRVVVYAGAAHGLDYYFATGDRDSLYLSYPVGPGTPRGNPEYQAAAALALGEDHDKGIRDNEGAYYLATFIKAYWARKNGASFRREELLDVKSPPDPKALILLDPHGVPDSELATLIGDADAWKKRGTRGITFAVEGFDAGKLYSPDDLAAPSRVQNESLLKRLELIERAARDKERRAELEKAIGQPLPDPDDRAYREKRDRVLESLRTQRADFLPELSALAENAKRLKAAGIEVRITGLEPPDSKSTASR